MPNVKQKAAYRAPLFGSSLAKAAFRKSKSNMFVDSAIIDTVNIKTPVTMSVALVIFLI
jgi:hypothetical protein